MKINRLLLPIGEKVIYDEEIDFSSYRGDPYHVKRINSCFLHLEVINYDALVSLSFRIKGEVVTTCAYTLEEIPYQFNVKEVIELNEDEDDEYDIINNEIDIDEMLITLIVSNVPMKVIKKGATLPKSGDGYRVISEEDAEKERKASPFDVLDDLEVDN